ncbi:MAG TPA: VCBS repeat-containing protein, partial [Polyangiaceae bacterium]
MRSLLALSCLSLIASCTNFPSIPSGECGNGVIDQQTEDCDSFVPTGSGLVCRAKGSDGECHFDCSQLQDGRVACPAGWGCGTDSICRAPMAGFEAPTSTFDVGAWSLSAGDFDGDGRGDVMSSEPLDSIGATRISFFYFDEQGEVSDSRAFPKLLLSPTVTEVSGDHANDVAFAAGALGLMLGRKDRTWVPETFSSYHMPDASVRVVSVYAHHVESQAPIVPLLGFADHAAFYVAGSDGQLVVRASLGGTIAQLAGDPVSGDVFEDAQSSPCLEPVFALRGQTSFTVLNTCETTQDGVMWRAPFTAQHIALEPRVGIDGAPQVVDLNGDGHLDVLLGAGGKPYVSYGDGVTLATAVPYRLPIIPTPTQTADIPTPLAVGDFSGDGVPDFVFPDHLLVSSKDPSNGQTVYSSNLRNRLGSAWTTAKIADFNANGKLDVVAASSGSLNLELYNGTGNEDLIYNVVRTTAPVEFLAVGDFDGDLVTDLAMVEAPPVGEKKSPMQVAFGGAFSPLSQPVTVAQVLQPDALVSYDDAGLGNLVVSSHETIAGVANGALTVLGGSSDRIPYAPFALTELSSHGSLQDSAVFSLAVGSFSAVRQADVLALAFPLGSMSAQPPTQPWLLPAIESAGTAS